VGKLKVLPGVLAFYGLWYPRQWIPRPFRYSGFGSLTKHIRFVDRSSRRLARTLFHKMVRYGAGLQRRQLLLFRGVDIAAELFAMAAVVCRVQMLVRTGRPHSDTATALADLYCRQARRRVRDLFDAMKSNDDEAMYRTARRVLDGEFEWMEEGIVGLQRASLPGGAAVGTTESTGEPAGVGGGPTAAR
jgi:hypothetical protein